MESVNSSENYYHRNLREKRTYLKIEKVDKKVERTQKKMYYKQRIPQNKL